MSHILDFIGLLAFVFVALWIFSISGELDSNFIIAMGRS
jgi:hypothetical protein